MKKNSLCLILAVILLCCIQPPAKSYALSVTPVDVKMYTTSGTPVFAVPDVYSSTVIYLERFVNVTVTGITDNGFYQVNLNGTYYIPGPYLVGQIQPEKTERQKALENLDEFTQAYQALLEQMESYSSAFGLLDITGDGVPELFDLTGKEVYTYYDGRAAMMYYSEYPLTFYYNKNSQVLLGKYAWNSTEVWEVYYRDTSLLPWGQLRCVTTDASAYRSNASAVTRDYTNNQETRADLYNVLYKILNL